MGPWMLPEGCIPTPTPILGWHSHRNLPGPPTAHPPPTTSLEPTEFGLYKGGSPSTDSVSPRVLASMQGCCSMPRHQHSLCWRYIKFRLCPKFEKCRTLSLSAIWLFSPANTLTPLPPQGVFSCLSFLLPINRFVLEGAPVPQGNWLLCL